MLMIQGHATLKNYRQSPRKVRLVTDLIRGKKTEEALANLAFAGKRSAGPVKTLLESALANAKDKGYDGDNLFVSSVRVDEGPTMFRRRPRARGSASPIRKRTSHIYLEVSDKDKEDKTVSSEDKPVSPEGKKKNEATVKK